MQHYLFYCVNVDNSRWTWDVSINSHWITVSKWKHIVDFRNRFRRLYFLLFFLSLFGFSGWIIWHGLPHIVSPPVLLLLFVRMFNVDMDDEISYIYIYMHKQQWDGDAARISDYEQLRLSTDKCNNRSQFGSLSSITGAREWCRCYLLKTLRVFVLVTVCVCVCISLRYLIQCLQFYVLDPE